MSGPRRRPEQAVLFDLELDEAPAGDLAEASLDVADPGEEPSASLPAGDPAAVRSRLQAAALDLGCHVAVAIVAAGGAALLGVRPEPGVLPGMVLLVLVFSLVYLVVPLAFWGKTAGMAAAGIVCRANDDQPLTFGEAARRWLGSLLTVVACGVPALLVFAGGRSLADRLSGTELVTDVAP
jgi:hypothetical protein